MHIPPKRSFHGLQGVPVEHRPYIWMVVSGAAARKAKQVAGYYQAMLHRGQVDSEVAHQIELVRLSLHPCPFAGSVAWGHGQGSANMRIARVLISCFCMLYRSGPAWQEDWQVGC